MQDIFEDHIGRFMSVYFDDITIYSTTWDEHLQHLKIVLQILTQEGFCVKARKCTFGADEIELLGHKVSKNGIEVSPSKIKPIVKFPIPTNKTEVRAFLGLASYYRIFVPNFSKIAAPLNELLRKDLILRWTGDRPDYWTPARDEAFKELKRRLTEPPILVRPDFKEPFILYTDASAKGFGAVLAQFQDKKERVLAYASRSTTNGQQNYSATHLELAAVVWAVNHFRHYLIGRPFQLVTDHSALKWLISQKNPSGIVARWITRLSEYEIDIQYRPGRLNQNADALSRAPSNNHHPYFVDRLKLKHQPIPDPDESDLSEASNESDET